MKPTAALPALLAGAMLVSCSGLQPSDDRAAHAAIDTLAVPADVYEETGRILGGVSYDHGVRVHHGPYVLIGVEVEGRVPGTPEPAPLRLAGADPVELRLFLAGSRTGRPVWTSRGSGVGECKYHRVERIHFGTVSPAYPSSPSQPDDTVPSPTIPLGMDPSRPPEGVDSASIRCGYPTHHIMGDSLPPGRYALAARVHTQAGTLAFDGPEVFLVADTLPLVGDPESLASHLRYTARAWVADSIEPYDPRDVPSLETVVSISNVGPRRLSLFHGSCPVRIRAFLLPERTGRPAWESGTVCDDLARRLFLSPGETVDLPFFHLRLPVRHVLGDTLLDGDYRVEAEVLLSGEQWVPDAHGGHGVWSNTTVRVPAGRVRLALPRPPLPSERQGFGPALEARTEILQREPTRLRSVVTARWRPPGGMLLRYSRDCAVLLHAYRDRARRDAAPRSGPPDWSEPRECGPALGERILEGGSSTAFATEATAREILGDTLPEGLYHFAVSVQLEHVRTWLAAGEARLVR